MKLYLILIWYSNFLDDFQQVGKSEKVSYIQWYKICGETSGKKWKNELYSTT